MITKILPDNIKFHINFIGTMVIELQEFSKKKILKKKKKRRRRRRRKRRRRKRRIKNIDKMAKKMYANFGQN